MLNFKKSSIDKCLVCKGEDEEILDMSINRTFRNDENIITFAICKNCINQMAKELKNLK